MEVKIVMMPSVFSSNVAKSLLTISKNLFVKICLNCCQNCSVSKSTSKFSFYMFLF